MLRGGEIRGLLLYCYFELQQQQPQSVSPMSFLTLIPTMQYLTSFVHYNCSGEECGRAR